MTPRPNFPVLYQRLGDPQGLDADHDGVGCETY